jgi:hypothetical protein
MVSEIRVRSTDLAALAVVGGSWGQQFLASHSDICTPVGSGSVELGDKVFPRQGTFPLSSHQCCRIRGKTIMYASGL